MLLSKDMNLGAIKATPPNDMGGESRYLLMSTARQEGGGRRGKAGQDSNGVSASTLILDLQSLVEGVFFSP